MEHGCLLLFSTSVTLPSCWVDADLAGTALTSACDVHAGSMRRPFLICTALDVCHHALRRVVTPLSLDQVLAVWGCLEQGAIALSDDGVQQDGAPAYLGP